MSPPSELVLWWIHTKNYIYAFALFSSFVTYRMFRRFLDRRRAEEARAAAEAKSRAAKEALMKQGSRGGKAKADPKSATVAGKSAAGDVDEPEPTTLYGRAWKRIRGALSLFFCEFCGDLPPCRLVTRLFTCCAGLPPCRLVSRIVESCHVPVVPSASGRKWSSASAFRMVPRCRRGAHAAGAASCKVLQAAGLLQAARVLRSFPVLLRLPPCCTSLSSCIHS